VVVIISFSFFGTYSTLGSNTWREQVAFKAINGQEVTRFEMDEMALFLATDNEDKRLFGGVWGPNFLNDGVIRKDFLETGLGEELAIAYQEDLQEEIRKRLAKEKKTVLYSHPDAPFLSVDSLWSRFAPEMRTHFHALQAAENGLDREAFDHRVKLYLAEKKIPASTLRYLFRFQEKQYGWLKRDERLDQIDLSLFGYHTLEDWFGPRFTRLITAFIINAAILAEKQGYEVSKAEALTDLLHNTEISYRQNQESPHLGVASREEYLNEQLRYLNMDQGRAVKIWRQVLLFRRYFQDAAANALLDTLPSQLFHRFADENVTVDLYRLPSSLRLANDHDLQQLEVYLQAVSKQDQGDPLALPRQFLTASEVVIQYPELVQKRFLLGVAQVSQKSLQARIGLRELWDWEVEDRHWEMLTKPFPTLAVKEVGSSEERFEALESLDATTRSLVDAFAKQFIVKEHPEWIDQALEKAKQEKMVVALRTEGGKFPFSGLDEKEKRREFIHWLEEAVVGESVSPDSPLYQWNSGDQTYRRIAVLDRAPAQEILTFAEARSDGTLDVVGDRILEEYYVAIRGKNPSRYQNEKKEWKSFKDVRDLVVDEYLTQVMLALAPIQKELSVEDNHISLSKDRMASLRFYPYLNGIKEELSKEGVETSPWIKEKPEEEESPFLPSSPPLVDQWKIPKTTVTLTRQVYKDPVDVKEALALSPHAWSSLKTPANGDLFFYQVKNHGEESDSQFAAIAEETRKGQALLGAEAQRHLMRQVLEDFRSQKALTFAYLNVSPDGVSDQERQAID